MSVIVRGMEMPENCYEGPFGMYDYVTLRRTAKANNKWKCVITGKSVTSTKRNRFCPLSEVPTPHGRLIDADNIQTINEVWYDDADGEHCICGEQINSFFLHKRPNHHRSGGLTWTEKGADFTETGIVLRNTANATDTRTNVGMPRTWTMLNHRITKSKNGKEET